MSRRNRQVIDRKSNGSATSEFVIAIGILFLLLFFPLLDLMFMGFMYSSGYLLQGAQLRQAAMVKKSLVDAEMQRITDKWVASGPGQFVMKGQAPPTTKVEYKSRPGGDFTVKVTTTVTAKSILPIPGLSHVPGLGAPINFTYSGDRLMENPLYVNQ